MQPRICSASLYTRVGLGGPNKNCILMSLYGLCKIEDVNIKKYFFEAYPGIQVHTDMSSVVLTISSIWVRQHQEKG